MKKKDIINNSKLKFEYFKLYESRKRNQKL